jgi:hypothetical protein
MSSNSSLSLALNESFTLDNFEIIAIRVIPHTSANIDIVITASNTKIYNRTLLLDGDNYTAWIDDDYLYTYIQNNISTIFQI